MIKCGGRGFAMFVEEVTPEWRLGRTEREILLVCLINHYHTSKINFASNQLWLIIIRVYGCQSDYELMNDVQVDKDLSVW